MKKLLHRKIPKFLSNFLTDFPMLQLFYCYFHIATMAIYWCNAMANSIYQYDGQCSIQFTRIWGKGVVQGGVGWVYTPQGVLKLCTYKFSLGKLLVKLLA